MNSFVNSLTAVLDKIDTFVWGPVMLILLVGTGIFLTIRTKALCWRNLPYALKSVLSKEARQKKGDGDVSPFSALTTALAATKTLVDTDVAVEAIKKFRPVEHRIEFVREIDGVKWYNDSASSSPTRTISGLNAFKENIILIAGGYDKNLEYEPLAKPVVDKVSTLILIGQTAEKIYDVVKNESEKENKKININMCDTLEQTIEIAKKSAKKGDVVLFSPASASFDMFKNFADRGNKFKDLVNKI